MGADNQTWVREFILLGLSSDWDTQVALFFLFSVTYLLTLLGNVLIVLLIRLDGRLHTPMYSSSATSPSWMSPTPRASFLRCWCTSLWNIKGSPT